MSRAKKSGWAAGLLAILVCLGACKPDDSPTQTTEVEDSTDEEEEGEPASDALCSDLPDADVALVGDAPLAAGTEIDDEWEPPEGWEMLDTESYAEDFGLELLYLEKPGDRTVAVLAVPSGSGERLRIVGSYTAAHGGGSTDLSVTEVVSDPSCARAILLLHEEHESSGKWIAIGVAPDRAWLASRDRIEDESVTIDAEGVAIVTTTGEKKTYPLSIRAEESDGTPPDPS